MPLRSPAALRAALLSIAAVLLLSAGAAHAAAFTDAAGRRVILPDYVGRILPAERNAEVLVLVLAPDKLAGLERASMRGALLPHGRNLPVLGWQLRASPASVAATARRVRADVIIDAGRVTPERAAFAERVQQLSGIPYILVDDSFERMPRMLRSIGAILGVGNRADDLGLFAEHAIAGLRGRLLIRPADTRRHVYYGLGPRGLITALPGSPAGAALDEAGAINVAAPLGRGSEVAVTPEQLLQWDPEIIIAERRSFYNELLHGRFWRRLSAVRNRHVYLEPGDPFGWIEDPASVNRLIGLHWLSVLFYPDATQEDLRTTTCDFYDKFYRIKLTNGQIESMMRSAGVPPPEVPHPSEPLAGLGAPLPALSAGTLGTPATGATTPPAPPPLPGMPSTAPSAACTVPTGPSPQPLPGISTAPPTTPGVPGPLGVPSLPTNPEAGISPLLGTPPATGTRPPGRRGRTPPPTGTFGAPGETGTPGTLSAPPTGSAPAGGATK